MKKRHIHLEYNGGLAVYYVTQLKNCATFTTYTGALKMIGSTLYPREAEMICRDKNFEVTITQAC